MKRVQMAAVTLIVGVSVVAGTVIGTVNRSQASAVDPLAARAASVSQVPAAQAQQLRVEIRHLRHKLAAVPGARFRGFVDNGCKHVTLTTQETASNPPSGPNDPRVTSCPYNLEHLSPTWDGPPSATQTQIYIREMQLFPLDITFAEATKQIQAALSTAP